MYTIHLFSVLFLLHLVLSEHGSGYHGGGFRYRHHQHGENHEHHQKHEPSNHTDKEDLQMKRFDPSMFRYFYDHRPKKAYIFNIDRYSNWSEWSECLLNDCIEVRYRACLDDSWEKVSTDRIHTTFCPSKYMVEKRTCANTTKCNAQVGEKIISELSKSCGTREKAIALKITGGQPAKPNSWPWAVRLSITMPGEKPITFCGATLIAPNWILTAAHCLLVENKKIPVGRMVNLNDYTKGTITAHFGDHKKSVKEASQQDHRLTRVILHPKYHIRAKTDGNDMALAYISPAVEIGPEVNFACLPTNETILNPGTRCYAVGWGDNTKGQKPSFDNFQNLFNILLMRPSLSYFGADFDMRRGYHGLGNRRRQHFMTTEEMHEVELPIVSKRDCSKFYMNIDKDEHICAGARGKDTCSGDSGGGLYCQVPDTDQWMVTGVTSFGLARACGLNPGVYASVSAHLNWIKKVLASPVHQSANQS